MPRIYRETFDDGPGGWFGWVNNQAGPAPLEVRDGCAVARSPWWVDYNHAPPGAGYLHMLYVLITQGPFGEHQREVQGRNRFVEDKFPINFENARLTVNVRGELETCGARMVLLIQGTHDGICSGWALTGQPIRVGPEASEQTITCTPDESQWTCLGARHDRADFYGFRPLRTVLRGVNADILFILFPLDVAPMGPVAGDPHRLRPERDYPVWRSRLPEGYILLDEVRIEFPG